MNRSNPKDQDDECGRSCAPDGWTVVDPMIPAWMHDEYPVGVAVGESLNRDCWEVEVAVLENRDVGAETTKTRILDEREGESKEEAIENAKRYMRYEVPEIQRGEL